MLAECLCAVHSAPTGDVRWLSLCCVVPGQASMRQGLDSFTRGAVSLLKVLILALDYVKTSAKDCLVETSRRTPSG